MSLLFNFIPWGQIDDELIIIIISGIGRKARIGIHIEALNVYRMFGPSYMAPLVFTQRKQLKAVSSLLFHYIASFRSGRLVLGAESKRRNKIQKLMNKCNYLDLVKRKIHKSLILIVHEFVLSCCTKNLVGGLVWHRCSQTEQK